LTVASVRLPIVLVAVFGAVQIFLAYRDYGSEDAFITYRYAQNLAAGNGFVFNPGERVLGTSTPLYAMVLGVAGALGFEIARASAAVSAASLGAVAILGAGLLRGHGHPALAILFATLAVWGAGDLFLYFGMETPFYLMLLLATYRAALARQDAMTGILLGLAFLTRHDAALFAVCLLALSWWQRRQFPWRVALIATAVVVPWLVFATIYFGSPVPNTLIAKAGAVTPGAYLRQSVPWQVSGFHSPLFLFMPHHRVPFAVVGLSTLALMAPIVVAWRSLVGRELLLAQALVFPVSLWLGYSLIGAGAGFAWYLVPASYFLALLALLSWGRVLEGKRLAATRSVAAAVGALVLVLVTLGWMPEKLRANARSLTEGVFYRGRNGVYLTLARWIKDQGLQRVSVLMDEPGYFGYHSGSPIIDRAGLITEGIYFTGPRERQTRLQEIIANYEPGLIVMPAVPWPVLRLPPYLPLYHPVPVRALYVRRSVFAEHFESLARHWLARDGYHPDRPPLFGHPLEWNFEPGVDSAWTTGGDFQEVMVEQQSLHTNGAHGLWGTVSSPPFLIDFDELTFQFGGTHPLRTRARLLIDGQEVLSEGGRGAPLQLHDVRWPIGTWTGKVGVLQFHDADTEDGSLAAAAVRSIRHPHRLVLDDFESGTYGSFWEQPMGDAPASLDPLAMERGLAMLVGRRGALSRRIQGGGLVSRPFTLDHDSLSFLVFDFGGPATRVELSVGGKVRRQFVGTGSQRLQGVVWRVRALRGRRAVLRLVDEAPGEDRWIGIDDIAVFDEAPGRLAAPRRPADPGLAHRDVHRRDEDQRAADQGGDLRPLVEHQPPEDARPHQAGEVDRQDGGGVGLAEGLRHDELRDRTHRSHQREPGVLPRRRPGPHERGRDQ
jgi:hypothetical protein